MQKKTLRIILIVFGVLVVLFLLAGPIMAQLGFETYCITGEFPDLKFATCPAERVQRPPQTPYQLPTAAGKNPIPVIFDDDGSPDGLIALLFFLRNPAYDIRAVTISQGEAHPEIFSRHLAQLLADLGRADIPVGFGRDAPLEGDNAFPEPWRQASDQFFEIELTDSGSGLEPLPAVELIIQTLTESSEPMLVFISGTHTNLAEALRIAPEITEKISQVYSMGGSIYVPGNIESDWPEIHNKVAEWNIWVDPLAAREVFASGIPVHLVPIDATDQVTWTKADARTWRSISQPEARLAGDILDWMLRSWSLDAGYIWDLVAAAAATDHRLCPEVQLALDVVVDPGPDQGQTIVSAGAFNVWVCLEPDAGQIRARVGSILGE